MAADGVEASLAAGRGEVVEVAARSAAAIPAPRHARRARDAREGFDILGAVEAGASAPEVGEAAHARELSHGDGRDAEAGGHFAGGHERRFVDGWPSALAPLPQAGEGIGAGGYAKGRVSSAVALSLAE